MFAWLARLAAQGLEGDIERDKLEQSVSLLRRELDHDRVLVDITNSVLSHLDIDELVADVSREIHRFFGVDTVAMVLRDALRSRQLMWNSTDFTVQPPTSQQYPLRSDSQLLHTALNENHATLLQKGRAANVAK